MGLSPGGGSCMLWFKALMVDCGMILKPLPEPEVEESIQ
jgi:hypothetical protein